MLTLPHGSKSGSCATYMSSHIDQQPESKDAPQWHTQHLHLHPISSFSILGSNHCPIPLMGSINLEVEVQRIVLGVRVTVSALVKPKPMNVVLSYAYPKLTWANF